MPLLEGNRECVVFGCVEKIDDLYQRYLLNVVVRREVHESRDDPGCVHIAALRLVKHSTGI
jgi:hypothetical protein